MSYYYTFKEYNEHEGETWRFFFKIPLDAKQKEAMFKMMELFKKQNDSYKIITKAIPEYEVDILIKHRTFDGYMASHHNLGDVDFVCMVENAKDNEEFDFLYKGGIYDFSMKNSSDCSSDYSSD